MPTITVSRHLGVNRKDARFEIADGQYRTLKNLLSTDQSLSQRPGRTRVLTQIHATNPVTGGTRFYRAGTRKTTGLKSAGTGADDGSDGTVPWEDPGKITQSDNKHAKAALGSTEADIGVSHYLKATNFSFAVPAGATILGVEVSVERYAKQAGVTDFHVVLIKGGTIQTTERGRKTTWALSPEIVSYGGGDDLWGATLTPTDVNAATFGVAIAAEGTGKVRVDHIQMQVYYREAGDLLDGQEAKETVALVGTSLYSDKSGAWATINGANPFTNLARLAMLSWKAKLFIQDGDNGPYEYDGTTFTTWSGAPKAKLALLDRERIYLAHLTAAADGMTALQASDLDDPYGWTLSPTLSKHGIRMWVGKGDGDPILSLNRIGSLKVILKEKSGWGLFGDDFETWDLKQMFPVGTVNGAVVALCGDSLVWTDGRRVYAFNGQALDVTFGRNIEPWLEETTLANWAKGCAQFWNGYYLLSNGGGEWMIRDFRTGEWYGPWEHSARTMFYDQDADEVYFGGSASGDVWRLTGTTDDGTAISWEFETKAYGFGPQLDHWRKRARKVYFVCDGGIGTVTAKARVEADSSKDVTRTLAFTGSAPQQQNKPLSGPDGIHHALVVSGSGVGRIYEYGESVFPVRAITAA